MTLNDQDLEPSPTPDLATSGVDQYPTTRILGRCHSCAQLVFDHQPHEWANRHTHEDCWPYDSHAALYCGRCAGSHDV